MKDPDRAIQTNKTDEQFDLTTKDTKRHEGRKFPEFLATDSTNRHGLNPRDRFILQEFAEVTESRGTILLFSLLPPVNPYP